MLRTRLAHLMFSLLYGTVLQALPLMIFADRQNYLNYATYSDMLLARYLDGGLLPALANEPLWLMINIFLGQWLPAETVLRTIIFLGACGFSYALLRAAPQHAFWLLIFLLTPSLLKHHIPQLRQGLAMAVFYLGFLAAQRRHGQLLMVLSAFIHSSFFLLLPILLLTNFLRKLRLERPGYPETHWRLGSDVKLLTLMGAVVLMVSSLGLVAAYIGARQSGEYLQTQGAMSGLGFVFWLTVALLMTTQGKEFINRHGAAIGVVLLYLAAYWIAPVLVRVLASGLPLILLAGLDLHRGRRTLFIGLFLAYSAMQWAMELSGGIPFVR